MSKINKTENVKEQYKDDNNLSVRLKLHAKYSTNNQGLIPWLFEKYKFSTSDRILELGCGNGEQWNGRIENLPADYTLILSDFSVGMVKIVWEKYSGYPDMLAQRIDIQNIPFPDNCFDVVIANYMLYHVPDLPKALSEVKRVLKSGGIFYAATNGSEGMRAYLHKAVKQVNPEINAFTDIPSFQLQNGKEMLSAYFKDVKRCDYEDSLSVTETKDLIDWIKSAINIENYTENDLEGLHGYFESIRQKEGAVNIPKETGLFICSKK